MNEFQAFIGANDFKTIDILRNLFGEFLGTFLYVFVGVMSTISLSKSLMTSVIPVAFAFGLALSGVSHVVQRASGGHLNPAISISCLVVGEIKLLKCLCYILVQCCGACFAAFMVVAIVSRKSLDKENGVSHPLFVGVWAALVVEICITFLMVIVFKAMADPIRNDLNLSGPLVVGLSVAAGHLVGYLLSSSSMNPARSFGPALVNRDFNHHWIYWVGPILGGILGAMYYAFGIQDREALKRYNSRRGSRRKSSLRSIA